MVIVEAFANKLPVVASNLGAMQEIIEHGHNGLLFATGDAADLIEKISILEKDPSYTRALGINAKTDFDTRYSEEINCKQLIQIYQDAIDHAKN